MALVIPWYVFQVRGSFFKLEKKDQTLYSFPALLRMQTIKCTPHPYVMYYIFFFEHCIRYACEINALNLLQDTSAHTIVQTLRIQALNHFWISIDQHYNRTDQNRIHGCLFIHTDSVLSSTREGVKITVKSKCEFTLRDSSISPNKAPLPPLNIFLSRPFSANQPIKFSRGPFGANIPSN